MTTTDISVDRAADYAAFASSAVDLMNDYAARLKEVGGRLPEACGGKSGAKAPAAWSLLGEAHALLAGAEQLARFSSQEIEAGGLSRPDALRLTVKLTEFERLIQWLGETIQSCTDSKTKQTAIRTVRLKNWSPFADARTP